MITAFLLALAVALPLDHARASSPSSNCAAAERLIVEIWSSQTDQPPMSSDAEPSFKSPTWKSPRELVQGGWSGPSPSVTLLDLWGRDAGSTATRCANVRAYVAAKAIGLPADAQADAERTVVGLPVVNKGGTEALVQVVTRRRTLGSNVYLYVLRQSDGQWAVVSRRMLVIS